MKKLSSVQARLSSLSAPPKSNKKYYLETESGDPHSGPYDSEDEAEGQQHKLLTKAKASRNKEEIENVQNMKIVTASVSQVAGTLGDLIEDEQDFVKAVVDVLGKLRVFTNKSKFLNTSTRGLKGKGDVRSITFDTSTGDTAFDYAAWFAKNICPIDKRYRSGDLVVAVQQLEVKGKTIIQVMYGHWIVMTPDVTK